MKNLELFSALMLCACAADPIEAPVPTTDPSIHIDRDRVLANASQQLAGVLGDAKLRAALRERLAERVTGDFEVLLDSMRDFELSDGRLLGDVLGDAYALEHVQIAAPLGVDRWTDDAAPLVTFVPAKRDATELAYFDAHGALGMRSADEEPTGAVLVLGTNERTAMMAPVADRNPRTSSAVYLRELVIWHDNEPWYKGDPEIYLKCNTNPDKIWLNDVNEEGERYTFNKSLGTAIDANSVMCDVKESDDDSADDNLGSATFSVGSMVGTTTDTCFGQSRNDFLMGAAKVKGYKTFTVFGQTVTVDAGCDYYFF